MILFEAEPGMKFLDIITYPEIRIEEGKFTFITGDSGCGKSTLLKLINKTALPSAGEVKCYDSELVKLPILEYRKEVLLVPQEVYLLDKTVEENFAFYYDMRDENPPDEETMQKFLHLASLDVSTEADCRRLSGGERKRVFLAIFLSFTMRVLLLDEPTTYLDFECGKKVLENIKAFADEKKLTVVCVSHNRVLSELMGDYCIRLEGKQ